MSCGPDTETIALSYDDHTAKIAATIRQYGDAFRRTIQSEMAAEVRNLKHVRRLQRLMLDHPCCAKDYQQALDQVGSGKLAAADTTEALLELTEEAEARACDPAVALTIATPFAEALIQAHLALAAKAMADRSTAATEAQQAASAPPQRARPAPRGRARHAMLSDPDVRDRLRLAGHPAVRRALGYR